MTTSLVIVRTETAWLSLEGKVTKDGGKKELGNYRATERSCRAGWREIRKGMSNIQFKVWVITFGLIWYMFHVPLKRMCFLQLFSESQILFRPRCFNNVIYIFTAILSSYTIISTTERGISNFNCEFVSSFNSVILFVLCVLKLHYWVHVQLGLLYFLH